MKILAMDTSTLACSAAVVVDGVVVAESTLRVRDMHSEMLLELVDEVLTRASCPLARLDLLAVGIGPGSFTGVRIGVATAKGLRVATGLALVGVSSLDALAAAAVGARGLLATVIDARRGELFGAVFRCGARGERSRVIDAMYAAPEAMGAALRRSSGDSVPLLALGDLDAPTWERVASGAGGLDVLPSVAGAPLARFVALEAATGRHPRDDDDALEPAYVRPSDARPQGA